MNRLFMSELKKILLTVVLCLCLPAISLAQDSTCRDLKKVSNLDELLYQMYINLDSDCLFTTPLSELEEVWGFEIFPENRLHDKGDSSILHLKPYHSEADAFVVFASSEGDKTTEFKMVMTHEYSDQHGTLFPNGNPKSLPAPSIKIIENLFEKASRNQPHCGFQLGRGGYTKGIAYYWLNTQRTQMIYFLPHFCSVVSEITFGNANTDYLNRF